MFRKPVKGKKAKTISCKEAHLKEQVSDMVYKNPDIKRVSQAEVIEKTSYIQVMDADIEGASVRSTKIGKADNVFHDLGQNLDDLRNGEQGGEK